MRLAHERAVERPRGLLPPSCETPIERTRRGMRPETGARIDGSGRGRALHRPHLHRIGRTRSLYARSWREDGRLAVLLPARQIALLRAVCEVGVMPGRRARCGVFERTRGCQLTWFVIPQRLVCVCHRRKHGIALLSQRYRVASAGE